MYSTLTVMLSTFVMVTQGYQHFRYRIPNGEFVIHPCFEANVLWYGVGHKNPLGGGERNQFGLDFANQGYRWTKCLCQMDSDGDGMTNGDELGDPDCTWKEGENPYRRTNITHPGVCVPLNAKKCSGHSEFVECRDPTVFHCPAIEAPGVKTVTLEIPETPVPAEKTTYKCMAFDLPQDGDYHLIASSPNIDNDIVMHHLVLYGCRGTEEENNARRLYATPTDCGMSVCNDIISGWTIGMQGQCFSDEYGVRIGNIGLRVVVMEIHWNNPELKSTYTDATSLDLYYTADRRTYDAGNLFIGPALVLIPPGYVSYDVVGACSSECLGEVFSGTWYLAEILPHMHYLGSAFKLELIHDGVSTTVYEQTNFFYDNPQIYQFENDVAVEPGDELRVTCTYTSKSRDAFTHYGQATSDEMCYAVILYYPFVSTEHTFCAMSDNYGFCPSGNITDFSDVCDIKNLLAEVYGNLAQINSVCDSTGKVCNPGCESAIEPILSNSCMTSDAVLFITSILQIYEREVVKMLFSCGEKPTLVAGDKSVKEEVCPDNAVSIGGYFGQLFVTAVVALEYLFWSK